MLTVKYIIISTVGALRMTMTNMMTIQSVLIFALHHQKEKNNESRILEELGQPPIYELL